MKQLKGIPIITLKYKKHYIRDMMITNQMLNIYNKIKHMKKD